MMVRKARVRRALNREPTSLAAVLGGIEVIKPNLALVEGSPISHHSTLQSPSTPSQPLTIPPISTIYPLLDNELDVGYIYPILPPP
jgi:hypothetical protein